MGDGPPDVILDVVDDRAAGEALEEHLEQRVVDGTDADADGGAAGPLEPRVDHDAVVAVVRVEVRVEVPHRRLVVGGLRRRLEVVRTAQVARHFRQEDVMEREQHRDHLGLGVQPPGRGNSGLPGVQVVQRGGVPVGPVVERAADPLTERAEGHWRFPI